MREEDSKIILTLCMLILVVSFFLFSSIKILNEEKINENYVYDYLEEQQYSERYRGFNLISDKNDFSPIENILDKLDIMQSDYPGLITIYYYYDVGCNGHYLYDEIMVGSCNETTEIRNYKISSEDIETFIFAHELGHYLFDNYYTTEKRQDLADDYAYNLTKLGEKVK